MTIQTDMHGHITNQETHSSLTEVQQRHESILLNSFNDHIQFTLQFQIFHLHIHHYPIWKLLAVKKSRRTFERYANIFHLHNLNSPTIGLSLRSGLVLRVPMIDCPWLINLVLSNYETRWSKGIQRKANLRLFSRSPQNRRLIKSRVFGILSFQQHRLNLWPHFLFSVLMSIRSRLLASPITSQTHFHLSCRMLWTQHLNNPKQDIKRF